ncbi:MAG TPA: antibiotic biosynthesis monooxygenase [Terriglobales bacterium]|nr:antibiotic biosynthesis monooxygenase [Terriglobales bacterium]
MFARITECTLKSEKMDDFTRAMHDEVRPILQKQTGFVDEITLVSDVNPGQAIVLTFWSSREDAERYELQTYPRILNSLQALLSGPPTVNQANVADSTAQKIGPRKNTAA